MIKIELEGWGAGHLICELSDIHHVETSGRDYMPIVYLRNMPEGHEGYKATKAEGERLTALLTSAARAETPAPQWNIGVDTVAFSRLMVKWYEAKKKMEVFEDSRYLLDDIQAEKDAYYAVIDFIAQSQALPADVIAAWRGAYKAGWTTNTEIWDEATRILVALMARYIPAETEDSDV